MNRLKSERLMQTFKGLRLENKYIKLADVLTKYKPFITSIQNMSLSSVSCTID